MSISIEFGPMLAFLRDLEKLPEQMPKITAAAGAAAHAVGIQALTQGVYGTGPGKYVRTNDLVNKFKIIIKPDGFEVTNTSAHASIVEHGSARVGGLDVDAPSVDIDTGEIHGLPGADALHNRPGYYDRTAKNWEQPEPFLAPAAVIGFYRLTQGVETYIQNVVKRHAR